MKTNEKYAIYPLSLAKENETVTIYEVKGGQNFRNNCIKLGIVNGQEIKILNNCGRGPSIIMINNSRIMLGNGMVNRIYVYCK